MVFNRQKNQVDSKDGSAADKVSTLKVAPNILKFTNNTGEQAVIEILVEQDVTPTP